MSDAPVPQPPQVSDEQLIDLYRVGETGAFETLIHRYRQELFHFLIRFAGNRAAAEDVFQETFLQVHLSIQTFDTQRRFKPWLFTIAANKARDYLRRKARRSTAALSAPVGEDDGQTFADFLEADLPQPGEAIESQETAGRVREAIDSMPDHLREILLLSYFQKFSYNEIADVLGIPLGTVKSRLHAAVGTFAQKWKIMNRGGGES